MNLPSDESADDEFAGDESAGDESAGHPSDFVTAATNTYMTTPSTTCVQVLCGQEQPTRVHNSILREGIL